MPPRRKSLENRKRLAATRLGREKISLMGKIPQKLENLIDLLDERYTRSDVTDEEYDTGAKKWVEPASQ